MLNDERQRTVAAVSSGRQVVQQPAAHALNAPSLQSWLNRLGTGRNDPLQSAQLRRLGPLSTLTRAEDPVRPAARAPACAGQASDRKVYRGSGTEVLVGGLCVLSPCGHIVTAVREFAHHRLRRAAYVGVPGAVVEQMMQQEAMRVHLHGQPAAEPPYADFLRGFSRVASLASFN